MTHAQNPDFRLIDLIDDAPISHAKRPQPVGRMAQGFTKIKGGRSQSFFNRKFEALDGGVIQFFEVFQAIRVVVDLECHT